MKVISIIVTVLTIASIQPVMAQQSHDDDHRKITVYGEAVIKVKPDTIAINLEIETEDPDINIAKTKNIEIYKKTMAALKQCGVTEKDIQTDYISINPKSQDEEKKKKTILYVADNQFIVTTSATVNIEDVITKVLQAGVQSVRADFHTSEYKKYREQARENALTAAKEKAEKMAKVLGQSIGTPIEIVEGGGRYSQYGQSNSQSIQYGSIGEDESFTIALGMITVKANVTVTFELKK